MSAYQRSPRAFENEPPEPPGATGQYPGPVWKNGNGNGVERALRAVRTPRPSRRARRTNIQVPFGPTVAASPLHMRGRLRATRRRPSHPRRLDSIPARCGPRLMAAQPAWRLRAKRMTTCRPRSRNRTIRKSWPARSRRSRRLTRRPASSSPTKRSTASSAKSRKRIPGSAHLQRHFRRSRVRDRRPSGASAAPFRTRLRTARW